jgi:cysteine desulfurase
MDNNATTRVDPAVSAAMRPFLGDGDDDGGIFGNPNSLHDDGARANSAVRDALCAVGTLIGNDKHDSSSDGQTRPRGVMIATSGATESNNTVITGVFERLGRPMLSPPRGKSSDEETVPVFVSSAVEHPSVSHAMAHVARQGARVVIARPGPNGTIGAGEVHAALEEKRARAGQRRGREKVVLVSVMWANNETGLINDIAGIGRYVREECGRDGTLFHTDATQAIGKVVPCDGLAEIADFASISAHKFHGPKGVGALYVRAGRAMRAFEPLLHGGEQMGGLRSGTINVAGVVGMGAAARMLLRRPTGAGGRSGAQEAAEAVRRLRDMLEDGIVRAVPGCVVVGPRERRTPNTLLVAFPGVEGEALTYDLNLHGISVSTGSACASESLMPSVALTALAAGSPEMAHTGVRFSLSRFNTAAEVAVVIDAVAAAVARLRSFSTVRSFR